MCLLKVEMSLSTYPAAWNAHGMAEVLAAVLDHEDQGHNPR